MESEVKLIQDILNRFDTWNQDISEIGLQEDLRQYGMTSLMLVMVLSEIERQLGVVIDFNKVDFAELYSINGLLNVSREVKQ